MNEASSKFVDKLAMEKLIREKLTKVSHSPYNSVFQCEDISFNSLEKFCLNLSEVKSIKDENGQGCFILKSSFNSSHYKENNLIYLYHHPALGAECNILLVHGLFDDNISNYTFLIKQLNELKCNVFFMVLPYHYNRKTDTSLFSGEFFFSADVYRSRNAFKQAIYDVEASLQFVKGYSKLPCLLTGFSMGGCIAFRHHILKKQAERVFLINPVTDMTRLIWDNPLLVTVGRDLENSGFEKSICESIFKELDPCENLYSEFDGEKVAVVHSIYDQIIDEDKRKLFIGRTGIKNVLSYSSGHLNILRVPRLSRDICDFLKKD